MRRTSLPGLAIIAGCVLFSSSAAAETPQQQADKLFAEGRDLLVVQKDARAACDKFEAAIALDPTAPGVMLNLGLCYETLEKYATSLYWFRKAQAAAAEAKPEPLVEYENAAKLHTSALSKRVATVRIDVSQAPAGVNVSIDGRPVLPSELARVEVDADSVVQARATGKEPFRQTVQVTGQDAGTVQVVMIDEVIPPMRDPGRGRRRLAYIVGGTGVIVWGVTLAYGLNVRSKYDAEQAPYDGSDGDPYELAQKHLRWYGTGMFIAGTAAVGAAVYLYVTAPKAYRESAQQTVLAPMVGRDELGLSYSGSF
ncbi:MAG: hypothetical protein M3680_11780 [Myxococcota bacterium]|nr:hypothetical protein [Myxococcota bacterium]